MKRGLKLGDVHKTVELRPEGGLCGVCGWLARLKTAVVIVNFGPFEAQEKVRHVQYDTVHEFEETENYQELMDEALDSLNSDIEVFLDSLHGCGVI